MPREGKLIYLPFGTARPMRVSNALDHQLISVAGVPSSHRNVRVAVLIGCADQPSAGKRRG